MAYGVATANIYDLLDNNDSDSPQVEEPAAKAAPVKLKDAEKPVPSVAASVESRLKGNANGPSGGRGQGRGGRGGGRGQGRLNAPLGRVEGEVEDQGGAGDRASRGRQPRGKDLHKRHDNDRRDGTGRGHEVEKRGGGGQGNWGTMDEEIAAQEAAATEVKGVDPAAAAEEQTEPVGAAEVAEPVKEEKEMTLGEYEKLREEKRAGLNKKASSEVKADPKAFEGMKAYSRKTGEEENELELSNKKQIGQRKSGLIEKARKEKEVVETNFRVGQQETGRGGRGRGFDRGGRRDDRPGRGDRGDRDRVDREERAPRRSESGGQNGAREGGRGGRGGGFSGRGDRQASRGRGRGRDGPAPAIDDNSAFPTLGGKAK